MSAKPKHRCSGCGRAFATAIGLGMHFAWRRKRKPRSCTPRGWAPLSLLAPLAALALVALMIAVDLSTAEREHERTVDALAECVDLYAAQLDVTAVCVAVLEDVRDGACVCGGPATVGGER